MRKFIGRPKSEDLSHLPFQAFLLRPPYEEPQPVTNLQALSPARLTQGSILLLDVQQVEHRILETFEKWIPVIRRRFVSTPVVLWFPGDAPAGKLARIARRTVKLGVRAVVTRPEPMQTTLRFSLSQPLHIEADALEWFGLRGLRFTPDIAYTVQGIFQLAPRHRTLSEVLAALGIPASSVGAKFSKKILPPASSWLHLAQSVHAALRLQADPEVSICRVALEAGYGDHSALSRQFMRNFGLRPSHVRETLGWEWLLDSWLERSVSAQVQPPARAVALAS